MRLVYLLISISFSNLLISQTYYFENYSVNDGLAQSTVYSVIQDHKGYLWLGTASGVSKFDGSTFQNFTSADGIQGNGVRSVIEDKHGVKWLGHTGGGISAISENGFHKIYVDSNINTNVSSIKEDMDGNIWISTTGNGVYQIESRKTHSIQNLRINHFTGKDGLSDRIFSIYISNANEIFFITDVGIKKYNSTKSEFTSFVPEGLPSYFQITSMYIDKDRNTWYGTYNGGLYKQKENSSEIKIFDVKDGLAHNWISTINGDLNGSIWVGTWGGGITRIKNDILTTYDINNGLHDLKIWDIINDREGNVIIGTNENGIDLFKGEHFVTFSENNGLSNNQVWSILEDDRNRLWLATNSGISIYNKLGNGKIQIADYINESEDNLISDEVRFLKKDKEGRIWIGTSNGIVSTANANDDHHFHYPPRLNANISLNVIMAMDIDKDNNLWVGTLDGLIYYEINNRTYNLITQSNGLLGNEISEVYCDKHGDIWVGCTGKGLNRISGTEFSSIDIGGDYTPRVINEDHSGRIWIGTDGQGVIVYDKKKGIVETYSSSSGLLTDLITSIEIDEKNNVWVGTNKGLNKIEQESGEILTYTEKDGFIGIENKLRSSFTEEDGSLWFGTVKGATKYSPSKDYSITSKPLIQLTKLKVNLNEYSLNESTSFDYKQKSFNFNYKGIYFTNPNAVKYQSKLVGIDPDWSPISKLTFANYPALPPGKYTFMVKASAKFGVWTDAAEYSFVIHPPFWQTWWFYLLCLAVIATGIYYYIQYREKQLVQEKKVLEDKVAERTAEVVQKNDELATINEDITSSIRYAQRIQQAILPPDDIVKKHLPNSFVFFRPKDIVSGDFYWVSKVKDSVMFSAIDCTGHGVPGAFMSIIGHNSLDKIVNELKVTEPSKILDELNKSVSKILRQKGNVNGVKDGMDIALVSINYKKKVVEYAGAFNPFYLYRDGELIETKANKFAIGSFNSSTKKKYINHEFDLKKGDVIYLFSDGYPDQFGGPKGKKYMHRPFKKFLESIHKEPMKKQEKLIEEEFLNWSGSYEQTDDVIVIGVEV